jgi:pimeloyl-ACP methyl ester carboxylesterase
MNETHAHFEQRLITQDGITYSFSVANEASDRKAVFVHGVTGGKEDMEIMGRKVVAKGYATYLIDLPNHGKSSKMNIQTFDQMGKWLRDAIAAIGIAPDVISGNSYGSAICYNYAAQGFLPRHTQLVLGCPTPDISFMTLLLGKILIHLPHFMIAPFYNSRLMIELRVAYLSRSRNAHSRQLLRASEMHKVGQLDVFAATKMGHLMRSHNPFRRGRMTEAAQRRTTVVIGDRDNVVTRGSVVKLRRLLPYARFEIVHGVGHILHFESPNRIVQYVGEIDG